MIVVVPLVSSSRFSGLESQSEAASPDRVPTLCYRRKGLDAVATMRRSRRINFEPNSRASSPVKLRRRGITRLQMLVFTHEVAAGILGRGEGLWGHVVSNRLGLPTSPLLIDVQAPLLNK
nr:hypothetical protein Iba_chr07cCG6540 [Ipomoea batatas]